MIKFGEFEMDETGMGFVLMMTLVLCLFGLIVLSALEGCVQ